ncbi:MAG: hypothetical protein ACFE95_18880, partial [Candidatus Hodarchaeota archaeon]
MIGINFFAQGLLDLFLPVSFLAVLIIIGFLAYYFRDQVRALLKDTLGIGGPSKTILEQEIEQRL